MDNGDVEDNAAMEKDATEAELERLVFGDEAGFREGIKSHVQQAASAFATDGDEAPREQTPEDEQDEALEGLDDSALFFLDAGPGPSVSQDLAPYKGDEIDHGDTSFGAGDVPAWEDSDDERIMVSLATDTRLRKLRNYEGEDLVDGREYTKRLRRQFERLNPVPEWVVYASERLERKGSRRRKSAVQVLGSEGDRSEDDGEHISSADEMDVDHDDEERLSAQPLAELLQNAGILTNIAGNGGGRTKRRKLRPEVLDIQHTRNIPGTQPSAINSLSFHPQYPLLLSSGPSSTLYLHCINPSDPNNPNALLTSLHIRHTPLTSTAFHPPSGDRIFLSSPRRYFHIWDLPSGAIEKVTRVYGQQSQQRGMARLKPSPCGRWLGLVGTRRKGGVGLVNVLDARTAQWIAEARIESRGGLADFDWWADGEGLCIAGKAGDVVEWSLREKKMVARWVDEGAVGTTVLALGGRIGNSPRRRRRTTETGADDYNHDGEQKEEEVEETAFPLGPNRYIALGSASGIVNIYDRLPWSSPSSTSPTASSSSTTPSVPPAPKPLRTLPHLTTPTSQLVFSPDGQLLALSSRWKADALRLVHLPSATVYRNWPTAKTRLGRVTAVAFAPDSAMLAVGNEGGRIRLWDIRA